MELNGRFAHPVVKFLKKRSSLYDSDLLTARPITQQMAKFLLDESTDTAHYFKDDVGVGQILAQLARPSPAV